MYVGATSGSTRGSNPHLRVRRITNPLQNDRSCRDLKPVIVSPSQVKSGCSRRVFPTDGGSTMGLLDEFFTGPAGATGSGSVDQIARQVGGSPDQVREAMRQLTPAVT